jgi:hypothetical protein
MWKWSGPTLGYCIISVFALRDWRKPWETSFKKPVVWAKICLKSESYHQHSQGAESSWMDARRRPTWRDAAGCYRTHQLNGMGWWDRGKWLYQRMLLEASIQPLPWGLAPWVLCSLFASPAHCNKEYFTCYQSTLLCQLRVEYCHVNLAPYVYHCRKCYSLTENGSVQKKYVNYPSTSCRVNLNNITGVVLHSECSSLLPNSVAYWPFFQSAIVTDTQATFCIISCTNIMLQYKRTVYFN